MSGTLLQYSLLKWIFLTPEQGLETAVIGQEDAQENVENLGVMDRMQVMAMTMPNWFKCDDLQARTTHFYLTNSSTKFLAKFEEGAVFLGLIGEVKAAGAVEACRSEGPTHSRHSYGQAISPVHALERQLNKVGDPIFRDIW